MEFQLHLRKRYLKRLLIFCEGCHSYFCVGKHQSLTNVQFFEQCSIFYRKSQVVTPGAFNCGKHKRAVKGFYGHNALYHGTNGSSRSKTFRRFGSFSHNRKRICSFFWCRLAELCFHISNQTECNYIVY